MYEMKVGLEIDATKKEELKLLGPRLAKNLVKKGWELVEDVDREKLRGDKGAEYLLEHLKSHRGRDKVDLMGDALKDLFQKADVIRREGEEFSEYLPRYRTYVKAVDNAFREAGTNKEMPRDFFGWYLLNVGMRLDPSDAANIKAKTESYELEKIENTLKVMWSGGGLAQKDMDRKRFKNMGKAYLNHEEQTKEAIYGVCGEDEEDDEETEDEEDQEQYEDLAAAVMENPEDEQLLTAFQDARKKMGYREARKVLAKTRVSRNFYPVNNRSAKRDGAASSSSKGSGKGRSEDGVEFHGDCMRCGKYGHKARNCPQRKDATKKSSKETNYMVVGQGQDMTPVYLTNEHNHKFTAILDSGASETIIGVDTLQDLYEVYERMGFDARKEIQIDRTMHKTFIYGNGLSNDALGLAKITVGLLGRETEIEAHVVEGNTPLLLSSRFMYDQEITVDFKKGQAWFHQWQERVQLERASSYHLLLSILGFPGNVTEKNLMKIPEEDVLSEDGSEGSQDKRPTTE